ncbi:MULTISPECIES: hypothetical protein [Streptomyces]|uniref:Secreted protein n=1 Tax=Streptomyces doudnae TaxID=3075536 RepID=A0ABD5EPI9_9ACTN|nr:MULTISPECIES: hypothetical protein [unclassified Streptomyces]MDT0436521.1 hypothetical protein [Streptomyces sp. DSM 41981]MYQ62378.1 hypothetical protein [Streptomyces sp. SID4950]SCD36372.1 hypothetical protein GA0115242_10402 [Streptomyces sp. SolWspMP-5a-2]
MQFTTRRSRAAAASGAGVLGIFFLASLMAGTAGAEPHGDGSHCAYNIGSKEQECFGTRTEAQAFATQQIKDNAAGAQTGVEKPSDVVIGTLFEHWQYGGRSITLWGSRPCHADGKADFYFNLPDDWKDRVSSVQGWAECDIVLHSQPYLGGVESAPLRDLTPVIDGPFNDRAQSVEFR